MASSTFSFPAPLPPLLPHPPHRNPKPITTITCGPLDNRGPIIRGRTLSTEAILAVQSLKRGIATAAADPTALLSCLLKPELLAVLAELQRQGRPALALRVLSAARGEPWYLPDCSLFADMVKSLYRKEMGAEIDVLVRDVAVELEREGGIGAGEAGEGADGGGEDGRGEDGVRDDEEGRVRAGRVFVQVHDQGAEEVGGRGWGGGGGERLPPMVRASGADGSVAMEYGHRRHDMTTCCGLPPEVTRSCLYCFFNSDIQLR